MRTTSLRSWISWAVAAAVTALSAAPPAPGAPTFRELVPADRVRILPAEDEAPVVLAVSNGMTVIALTKAERLLAASLAGLGNPGDGGGASLGNLTVVQTAFLNSACPTPQGCAAPCNALLVLWTEATPKTAVRIVVDGALRATVPALPPALVPGPNGVSLLNVAAGRRVVRIEAVGNTSAAERAFVVLDGQPFADAQDLRCTEGPATGGGTCRMSVRFSNPGPDPDAYAVLLDDVFLGTLDPSFTSFVIDRVPAGEHELTLIGVSEAVEGSYRGCFVSARCRLTCVDEGCKPPFDLLLCQVDYGARPQDNTLLAVWENGESSYAAGLRTFVDGAADVTLAGNVEGLFLDTFALGSHRFGLQGDCGTGGLSPLVEANIEVLAQSPHSNPTSGEVLCDWSAAGGGTTRVAWTNGAPSDFIAVYLLDGLNLFFVGFIPGSRQGVALNPTEPDDVVLLQFFATLNGQCYGSETITCSPREHEASYVPGACNGVLPLDISTPIFALGFLFSGGAAPPCIAACDANGDGRFDVSDAIALLSFLFIGGPAPVGWIKGEPVCVEATEAADCLFAHEICPLE